MGATNTTGPLPERVPSPDEQERMMMAALLKQRRREEILRQLEAARPVPGPSAPGGQAEMQALGMLLGAGGSGGRPGGMLSPSFDLRRTTR